MHTPGTLLLLLLQLLTLAVSISLRPVQPPYLPRLTVSRG